MDDDENEDWDDDNKDEDQDDDGEADGETLFSPKTIMIMILTMTTTRVLRHEQNFIMQQKSHLREPTNTRGLHKS